jgi:site-specific DNA-methyltransferase (adenine-specific)
MGSFPYPRNGILKMDYEFILIFKKLGKAPKPTTEQKQMSEIKKEEWNEYFSSHWNFNGVKQLEHIAMFPEELPKRLIKMFSFYGETVLDPFLGSGTTSLAAKHLGRNSLGYEINKEFIPVIKDKLTNDAPLLNNGDIITFEQSNHKPYSYETLPYLFHDPHKMDKKIDIKNLQFGSKIDSEQQKREDLFSVKQVLSPEKILLSNGLTVRLLGIKAKSDFCLDAEQFLKNKFNKRKVFLKYDNIKYDQDNELMCYVYLDNKTFVNNHLIRTGYVDVDTSFDYSCKKKFLASLPV